MCREDKPLSDYALRKSTGKPLPRCRACEAARLVAWKDGNRDKIVANRKTYKGGVAGRAARKRYYEKHLKPTHKTEDYRAKARQRLSAEPALKRRRTYAKQYAKANRGKRAAWEAMRSKSLNHPISMLCKDEIEKFYISSAEYTKITGIAHHVDHYYPLRGKTVCGLHVPANLRVITRKDNLQKSNNMPEIVLSP